MSSKTNVQFCRMCRGTHRLVSLFGSHEKHLKSIKKLCGVDISRDNDKLGAMSCTECIQKLEDFAMFRLEVELIDRLHVQPIRDQLERDSVIEIEDEEDESMVDHCGEVGPTVSESQQLNLVGNRVVSFVISHVDEPAASQSVQITGGNEPKPVGKINTNAEISTCDVCNKKFSSKYYLKIHIQSAHEKRRHQCQSCHKSFASLTYLKHHQNAFHSGTGNAPPFVCPHCQAGFYFKRSLVAHTESVHELKRHQCQFCEKNFSTKYVLARHVKVLHEKLRNEC